MRRNGLKLVGTTGVILWLFLVSTVACVAQPRTYATKSKKAIKVFEEGLNLYQLRYLDQALGKFEDAMQADPNFADPYIMRAQVYEEMGKPLEAIDDYRRVIEVAPGHDPRVFYQLAQVEADELLLDEASRHVTEFLRAEGISRSLQGKARNLQDLIEYRKQLMANPVAFNPINLGKTINSEFTEHSPTLVADNNMLLFTRNQPTLYEQVTTPSGKDEDLYFALRMEDGSWGRARSIGESINTPYREGASCVSPDGRYLFFTSCDRPNGSGSCDLYVARKEGDNWVAPRNLGRTLNSPNWESQPSFSSDGRTLYFTSKRPGGKGDSDIWMSRIGDDSRWTKPVSLSINTRGSEQSPFIHPDGRTFYFSSNGYPGMGGFDLFVCRIQDDGTFSQPVNLGYPINNKGLEASLIVSSDGHTAYYASERPEGMGEWDIYRFELPEPVMAEEIVNSKGKVYDAESKEPVQAKFELIDLETGKRVIESFSDPVTGEFLVVIPPHKDYALNASANGYLFFSENFSLKEAGGDDVIAFNVPMEPIKVGKKVILKNIFFETDKYDLKPKSKVELDKLVQFLQANADVRIEIGGHTDNVGSEAYNQNLSENRAKAVYDYLVEHAIPSERLGFKGYNFSEPIATNETDEGRALNRRTEFKIIE